jgi:hypothetical protein
VTEAHLARKLDGLQAHRSQFRSTMLVDDAGPDHQAQLDAFRDRVRRRLAEHGALAGVPYGEAFKAITDL